MRHFEGGVGEGGIGVHKFKGTKVKPKVNEVNQS